MLFWWNIIKYDKWNFEYKKTDEGIVEIKNISSPKWNTRIRFCILIISQFCVYVILMISALLYIFTITNIVDIIKDSLAFVFILQIDEYIFTYNLSTNSYFKKIWKDDVYENTTYIYKKYGIVKTKYYKVGMCLTLPYTIIILTSCLTFCISEIINFIK